MTSLVSSGLLIERLIPEADLLSCIATRRETIHTDPVVTIAGVQHYAVGNMPGAVPFTSTEALVTVTLPYMFGMAGRGVIEAVTDRPELLSGPNTVDGSVCHPGVAKALGWRPCIRWHACAEP